MKRILADFRIWCGVALTVVIAGGIWAAEEHAQPDPMDPTDDSGQIVHVDCCHMPNPAGMVLDAQQFTGKVATSYAAAKEIPDVLCKLFCYCGCDKMDKHTTLLECFVSEHTKGCLVCQDEAIEALRMKKEGKTISEIQHSIDKRFFKEYPFAKTPTKALLDYRAMQRSKS
jgi:hypothetical protein